MLLAARYGNLNNSKCLCSPASVYNTLDNTDCNDSDFYNWNSCATCLDNDGDNWFVGCDAYTTINGNDCNDTDSLINPKATERYNQIDDNCDGEIDEGFCYTNENCSSSSFCNISHLCEDLVCPEGSYPENHTCKANMSYCPIHTSCLSNEICSTTIHKCQMLNCSENHAAFNHQCYHECDRNYDGIYVNDYNDLMTAYKCFLGVNNCNIYYQNWNLIKQEYECIVNNN